MAYSWRYSGIIGNLINSGDINWDNVICIYKSLNINIYIYRFTYMCVHATFKTMDCFPSNGMVISPVIMDFLEMMGRG